MTSSLIKWLDWPADFIRSKRKDYVSECIQYRYVKDGPVFQNWHIITYLIFNLCINLFKFNLNFPNNESAMMAPRTGVK
jgi:hypothetical protein